MKPVLRRLHDTTALCPSCDTVCAAQMEARSGDAWIHMVNITNSWADLPPGA